MFEMHEEADPVALAQSQLPPDLLPQEQTGTRVRRAVNLKAIRRRRTLVVRHAPLRPIDEGIPAPLLSIDPRGIAVTRSFTRPLQVMAVDNARSYPPTPRARARAHGAAAGAREGGAQEREEDPEAGEGEQQGLSPPATSEDSSSGEQEESDGGRAPREVGAFAPLAQSRGGGRGESAWGGRGSSRCQSAYERGDEHRGGASARRGYDWGCGGGHVGRGHHAEPPRKRKQGFSTLRLATAPPYTASSR
jgi:hypothetical protein